MAQTGYTPILIYSTTTASASPSAGNLTNSTLGSELAINITDGKLFYKDNSNAVQVIGWKTTPTSAGGTGLTSYTAGDTLYYATGTTLSKLSIGSAKTIMTSSGSAPQWSSNLDTSQGGTGVTTYTAGDLLYYASGTTFSKLPIGTNAQVLTSTGTAPQWSNASSISVGTATNLSGGAGGSVPYQSAASTTTFLSIGTANTVMTSSGSVPQWSTSITLSGNATAAALIPSGSSVPTNGLYLPSANTVALATNSGGRVWFDSLGNVGLGAAPSAWASTATAIQLPYGAALQTQHTGDLSLVHNAYEGTANSWKFFNAGTALRYHLDINNSFHKWYESSASGSAGGTVTWTQILAVARTKTLALEGATSKSGTGITFPATQSASTDVNTLDDYEEGGWTPTLNNFTLSGTQTPSGTYTKIGRMVYLTVYVTNTDTITSVAGTSTIGNLPFTPNSNNYAGVTNGNAGTIAALNHGGIVNAAGNVIYTPAFTVAQGNPLALNAWYIV